MDKFTADKIRSEVLEPLNALVRDVEQVADELEVAYEDRAIKKAWLPLNEGAAERAIKMLRRFYKKELRQKLDDAKDGTLRYREAELKFTKKKAKRAASTNGDE